MSMVGLVPARGGSKGIPGKNLALCGGKALLSWTAEAALQSSALDRVLLSTDDPEIARAGRDLGLDVPYLRPANLAADTTPMLDVIAHALGILREQETTVEAIVLLQPTSPLRRAHHIAEAVALFRETKAATVVSVTTVPHRFAPSSLMRVVDGALIPYLGTGHGPLQRQAKEIFVARNGPAVLIMRPDVIDAGRLYGDPTVGYPMPEHESIDIDTPDDMAAADFFLRREATYTIR